MSQNTLVIVGCGTMGCDVAAIFLAKGWRVYAVINDLAKQAARRERVAQSVRQLDASFHSSDLIFLPATDTIDWAGVSFVLESVPEQFDLKRQVFERLDSVVPPHVPIMTNTSGMRITEISEKCATRGRMGGLHFFLPAHLVPAVEVVRGEYTEQWVVEQVRGYMLSAGRVPIVVQRDVPGFLANRIQHALMREAFAVIDEGLGTPEDVDAAVRFGFGFRYVAAGPILQKELAGLDTQLAAGRSIYPSLHNGSTPSRTLAKLVAEGRLGIKTHHGFWKWTPETVAREQQRFERALVQAARILGDADPADDRRGSPDVSGELT